jgi:hypothetical protein
MRALIARQDAQARRTAERINAILEAYVPVATVAYEWALYARKIREVIGGRRFLDRLAALVKPADPEAFRAETRRAIAEALEPLAEGDARFGPPPRVRPPGEPRAVATTSASLPEARAQVARLHVRWIDLRGRITTLDRVQAERRTTTTPTSRPRGESA